MSKINKLIYSILESDKSNIEIKDIMNNKKTEEENLRNNFIKVCFCPEDLYRNFIVKKGRNSHTITEYDSIYDNYDYLLIVINLLLQNYSKSCKRFNQEPFPVDKFEFQIKFFNFLLRNAGQRESLKSVVKSTKFLEKFEHELKLFFEKFNNEFINNKNGKKVIHLLDNFKMRMKKL